MNEPGGLQPVNIKETEQMLGAMLPILKKLQGTDPKLYHPDILAQWLLQLGGWLPNLGGLVSEAHVAWRRTVATAKATKGQEYIKARKEGAKTATGAEKIAEASQAYLEKVDLEIAADGDSKRMINYREDVKESMQAIKKVIDLKIAEMKHGTGP